jgi:hypothetical protein
MEMVKVSIATAARLMNKGQQFVRIALQRNLVPFGFAVKMQEDSAKFDYYINPSQFASYLGITEKELEDHVRTDKKRKDIILPEPLF